MYCIAICRFAKTYHANPNDVGWSVLIRKWKIRSHRSHVLNRSIVYSSHVA